MVEAVPGDIYHIAERVREFDPDLFICWVPTRGRYNIFRHHQTVYGDRPVFVMPWESPLDGRLIHTLRYGDMQSGQRDIERELAESDARKAKTEEAKADELANEVAKDMLWAVRKDFGFN